MAKERERLIWMPTQTWHDGCDQRRELGEERLFQPHSSARKLNRTDLDQRRELVGPRAENIRSAAGVRKAEKTQFRFRVRPRLDDPLVHRE
jgi:hypothetical protein